MLTEDWNVVSAYIGQLQAEIRELEDKTPVKHAYGLCSTIGCQWNQIAKERTDWKKKAEYIATIDKILDELLRLVTSLVEAKILPIETWWNSTFAAINRKLEDARLEVLSR